MKPIEEIIQNSTEGSRYTEVCDRDPSHVYRASGRLRLFRAG